MLTIENAKKDLNAFMNIAYPLESERAHKAYGVPANSVNKILIADKAFDALFHIVDANERRLA